MPKWGYSFKETEPEIMVKAKKKDLKIKEIGVRHLPRTSGVSKVKMKHIFVTLCEIARLWKKLHSAVSGVS